MHNSVRRPISILILLSIIAYGMFKDYLKEFYNYFIQKYFNTDPLSEYLNDLSLDSNWDQDITAWLIYYPTYLLLHVMFIYVLFYKEIRIRNMLITGLLIFVVIDVILIIVANELEFQLLYSICYQLFRQLFGLPFILLAIEGGRHLFKELLSA